MTFHQLLYVLLLVYLRFVLFCFVSIFFNFLLGSRNSEKYGRFCQLGIFAIEKLGDSDGRFSERDFFLHIALSLPPSLHTHIDMQENMKDESNVISLHFEHHL